MRLFWTQPFWTRLWRITGRLTGGTILSLCVAGCGEMFSETETPLPPSRIHTLVAQPDSRDSEAESRLRGSHLFGHYCAICHGIQGAGDGFNSTKLKPLPRNLTDPKFQQGATDDHLRRVITQGGPTVGKSISMPAWGGTLSADQISDVIAHLRTLSKLHTDDADSNATATPEGE